MSIIRNKWIERLAQTKAFLAGCIVLLIIGGLAYGSYITTVESACLVRQIIITTALREHTKSNGALPENLSELGFDNKKRKMKYYPDAWNKPGKILLISSGVGSYIVTFGDGSRAVLISYDAPSSDEFGHRLRSRNILGGLAIFILLIVLILSFFTTFIIEHLIRKRVCLSSVHRTDENM